MPSDEQAGNRSGNDIREVLTMLVYRLGDLDRRLTIIEERLKADDAER